jgi:hypothetical protein
MAKSKLSSLKAKRQKKELSHLHLQFTSKNYIVIAIGIAVIILGYIFLSEDSVYGFMPTVVAPILLVIGYCVIIPYGILLKEKSVESKEEVYIEKETTPKSNVKTSSNVKTA